MKAFTLFHDKKCLIFNMKNINVKYREFENELEMLILHCWKTINVQKQYGHDRIVLLSILSMLAVFSVFYIALNVFRHGPVSDRLFPLFVIVLLMIYPAHKLLHFLPLFKVKHHLRFSIKYYCKVVPTVKLHVAEPVLKSRYITSLVIPLIVINTILMIGAMSFPIFRHYFALLLAFHSGLCLIDLLYVKHLVKAPKKALIEENDKGFQILVPLH